MPSSSATTFGFNPAGKDNQPHGGHGKSGGKPANAADENAKQSLDAVGCRVVLGVLVPGQEKVTAELVIRVMKPDLMK